MKQMFKQVLWILFLGIGFSSVGQAQEFGLAVGFKAHNANAEQASQSVTGQSGFTFGGMGTIPMSDMFTLRTGFLYTQRNLQLKVNSTSVTSDYKFTYLDIPVTGVFQFSDYAGFFIGPVLSMNLSKDISQSSGSPVNATGVASPLIPISFGVTFKFAPQMGGDFTYEFASSKVADGIKDYNSIGANLIIYFE